jgi:hypothetical protein
LAIAHGRYVLGYHIQTVRRILDPLLLGSRWGIAGSVYGTIVVMGTITAGSTAGKQRPWELAVVTAGTVVVLWLAHVYSHSLGESLERERAVTRREFTGIARREFAIPLAAVLPVAMLVLGALGVVRESRATWTALGIGVITLAAQGLRYARAERLGQTATIVAVAANTALGLAIVAMKAALAYH